MLRFVENFGQYGTDTNYMLNGLYAEVSGINTNCVLVADPDPTATGTVLRITDVSALTTPFPGAYVRRVITTTTTGGCMQRIWLNQLPADTSHCPYIALTDSGNTQQVNFIISPTGTIRAYRGTVPSDPTAGNLLGESAAVIVANAWQHIEFKAKIDDSTGTIDVQVEGVSVLSLSSKDTKNSSNASYSNIIWGYRSGIGANNKYMYVKDVAAWDTATGLNTDFLGVCAVYSMRPDGDDSGTWTITGGAGSAYASINETTPNDDTKYISSPWPAATADVVTLSDLPADATRILGMMTLVRSRKSDGGDGNLQVSMVSNGTAGDGTDRAITTAYTYWTDMFEEDPDTSAEWGIAAANLAKLKLNRTA